MNTRSFLDVRLLALLISIGGAAHGAFAAEQNAKSYPVLSGVGLALRSEDGHILVGKVVPNSPADRSGSIHEGARLISVETDGATIPLDGKTIGEAASIIRGPVDTDCILTFTPKGTDARITLKLNRAPLELAGVPDSSYRSFVGKAAPDLPLSVIGGETTTKLSDYRGRIVVLDFWASWCPTCYPPVTKLQEIANRNADWGNRVELITVSVDSDLTRAAESILKQGWNKTKNMAVQLEELKEAGITVIPVAIIVDTNGRIATMAGSHSINIENEVNALLAGSSGEPADAPKRRTRPN